MTWSRAVEYEIDEQNPEVRQVWEYGANIADPLMVTFQGDADWMSTTDNTLITFSTVSWVGGAYRGDLGLGTLHLRTIEVDHGIPAREAFDLQIHEGQLEDFSSHAPAVCSTRGATTKTLAPFDGGWYYLVVPSNGVEEGSYGTDSAGSERARGDSVCLGQTPGVCP